MCLNTDIINTIDIEQYSVPVEVVVLKDNKYKFGEVLHFKSLSHFIDALDADFIKGEFEFIGGNDKEIYIENDKCDNFTFQVSPFEFFKDSIDLEL